MRTLKPLAALGALVLTAGSAGALTPPMPCQFVPELGRFVKPDEPAPETAQTVLPDTFQNGFVYFEVEDLHGLGDGSLWLVVQYCPKPAGLVLRADPETPELRTRFNQMVFGDKAYSLRQIAEEMSDLGGQVDMGKVDLGSCPCDHQRFFYGE
jgi:hypothetical protein